MKQHIDPDINRARTALLDALCQWERETGRETFLVLVPVETDEEVIIARSGKPIPDGVLSNEEVAALVFSALTSHDDPHKHNFTD